MDERLNLINPSNTLLSVACTRKKQNACTMVLTILIILINMHFSQSFIRQVQKKRNSLYDNIH
ncbi:MAG TPA: hypothetical protein VE593_07330, partial [Nitrososphaeraceae archaeon]|nr:hypothetical protein [Nitrososphaeraceae archaeon]